MLDNKTIERLNEIRELRNIELFENGDNSVFYTAAMALEKGESGQQIYRIMEEYSIDENRSAERELFYKYKDKPELVAIIDPEKYEGIREPEGKEAKTEEQKEQWALLVKDIEEGRLKSKENIKNQAMKLGIDEKDIEGLTELDIHKKIHRRIDEKNEKNNDDRDDNEEDKDEAPYTLSKEDANRHGIIGVNSIPLDQVIDTHGTTLKEALGLNNDPKYADVVEIEVVPSYKVRDLGANVQDTPFVVVGRHSDGSIEAFPEKVCSVYKGENNKTVDFDGQKDEVNSITPNSIIQFHLASQDTSLAINQTSPYGKVEASLAYNTRDNNQRVSLNLRDKYEGTDNTDFDARDALDRHNGSENPRNIVKEKNEHEKVGCKETGIKEANGNPNDGHIHVNLESPQQQEAIKAIVREGKVSEEEATRLFIFYMEDKDNNFEGQQRIDEAKKAAINELNELVRGGGDPRRQ